MSSAPSNNNNSIVGGSDESTGTSANSPSDQTRSISVRARSNTVQTVVSSNLDDSHSASAATAQPNPPANTPISGSVAGDAVHPCQTSLRLERLTVKSEGDEDLEMVQTNSTVGEQAPQKQDSGSSGVGESSLWESHAEESVEIGLARLAQLAKDEHERDPSKSVAEYYSQHLAKLIKSAEIRFDATKLW